MNRNEIVQALEEKCKVKAKYLGAPTFAYEVGGYRVDRSGVVTAKEDLAGEVPSFEDLRMSEGEELGLGKSRREDFQGETGMRADDCPETQEKLRIDGYAVEFPLADHTGASLRNLVNMLASKQMLIVSAFGLTHWFMDNLFAEELSQKNTDSVELFQEAFQELGPTRCPGLEMDEGKRTVALKLTKADLSLEEMAAFRDLAVCINQNAQKLKTSSSKPAQLENPKYALRTWLIRLGMNGDEFKTTRKVLLKRLPGSSAFRSHNTEHASDREGD